MTRRCGRHCSGSSRCTKTDRLIVDDALWLDLILDGRDRRNVVWAYKVDTDEQVQGWAPDGWTDYDWVVSRACSACKHAAERCIH